MVVEYVEMTIATLIMLIGFWFVSDIVFEEKTSKSWKDIIVLVFCSMLITIFNLNKAINIKDIIKIIVTFVIMLFFNKSKYKMKLSTIIIGSAIVYINFVVADLILEIPLLLLNNIFDNDVLFMIRYTMISAIIVMLISLIIIKMLKKKYLRIFKKVTNEDFTYVSIILIIFLIITTIASIIPIKNLKFGIEVMALTILIFLFSIIVFYIITERIEKEKIQGNYKQLVEYAKVNENLLEDYRVSCHENKNHLIIIDNMVPKNNKKVHEYIKSISQGYKMNKYYFINELKNIPIVELKGFINFKLMQMLNTKMNLQINVSPEIKNSKLTKLTMIEKEDLYNIVGVLLDNAFDASKESKEKEVIFQMYKEKTSIVLLIANTYKGNVDIEKVSEYGYSSKGKNHGTGLYIVEKIINKNDRLSKETSIMDNYFVQTIKLK